ncbi:hypothetical protein AVEN_165020-1 [Araneus ventricosus]|uniref:Uncharacterized protein n=1 Tax=Araneus ventricosus TaxID=182803 RepID=A0A4Y2GJ09_ARAVE|nr:hypothetical protein AVEN_165020-1 [Araneus ventricosus]
MLQELLKFWELQQINAYLFSILSCFDEEFLKSSNRSPASSSSNGAKERLENLMFLLKNEVYGEERISFVMSGFGSTKFEDMKRPMQKNYNLETQRGKIPTLSKLRASTKVPEVNKTRCIFCNGKNASLFQCSKMTLEEKKIGMDKNCFFTCLLPSPSRRKCRKFLKCPVCSKIHATLM